MEVKKVRPGLNGSYEALFHRVDGKRWLLPLRHDSGRDAADALSRPLLERAIGVIYRPQSELQSHYFQAELPRQFDEYIWFDETRAVTPLETRALEGMPETYPFGV
jgi:protein-L-isoaspartate(D-aspartate) O-methyltransferase